MKAEAAAEAASHLARCWQIGFKLTELPPDCRPRTLRDGMQVQAALVAELDLPVGGWKVGCTSTAAQRYLKIKEPIAGRLIATRLFDHSAALPSDGCRGIEGEFAFVLGRDLPPRKRPYTRTEVMAAIKTLRPAIEIIDPRYEDWLKVNAASIVADLSGNGWLVLGAPVARWRTLDLRKQKVRVTVDGKAAAEGTGAEALGDPLKVMVWLANFLGAYDGLKAGEVVTTGTCTGFFQAPPSSTVVADFGKLGQVSVAFG